jgi:hypothetical protein
MSIRVVRHGILIVALVLACLPADVAHAQSKKTIKEAQKLSDLRERTKTQTGLVFEQVKSLLSQYNAILDGSADNRKHAYKGLDRDAKSMGKLLANARKSKDSVVQQAGSVWALWQADNDAMADGTEKTNSQRRLDTRKQRYDEFESEINSARESLDAFVANLQDQIAFMGKDLSDDGILDLKPEAEKLNAQADEIEALLAAIGSGKVVEDTGEVVEDTGEAIEDTAAATGAEDKPAADVPETGDPDSDSEAGADEVTNNDDSGAGDATNDDDSGAGDATTDDSESEDRPPAYDSD